MVFQKEKALLFTWLLFIPATYGRIALPEEDKLY
jgi:hypothetical protein